MIRFTCCECGSDVIDVIAERVPAVPLCCICTHMPGWTDNPDLRRVFKYDGPMAAERKETP
jgi:hypothetical protein